YLQHDYYTDIITFDQSEEESIIEGDIYISIDRIQENSKKLTVVFGNELHRVIVHGLLHLLGFGDKTEKEKKVMREKEEACLSLLEF
ncbi:MAG: rRNA maturation RNase YbeY, partial [Bacteroidota bacterium]